MNCLQYGCSQSGAISAAVGFLTDQGMVPPSVDRKEQRPTIGADGVRRADAIPVGNPLAVTDRRGTDHKLPDSSREMRLHNFPSAFCVFLPDRAQRRGRSCDPERPSLCVRFVGRTTHSSTRSLTACAFVSQSPNWADTPAACTPRGW